MSQTIVEFKGHLREAYWVGKSRPVIKHVFESNDGETFVVYSTSRRISNIEINEPVHIRGKVRQQNEHGTVLTKCKRVDF